MSRITWSDGDTGLVVKAAIDDNFTEIYKRGFVSLENYLLDSDPDYTLAFQRAVAALPESTGFEYGGGTIMLEGKDYTISETIVIEKSIKIIGAGSDAGTRISLADGSNCNMFEIGKRNSTDPISVTMEGIRIEMLGTQEAGYSNIVLYNYIRHSHFNDLFLVHATAANLRMIQDVDGTKPHNNYFYGCAFEYGVGYSVEIEHDYNLNFNSCYFGFGVIGAATQGIYIRMTAENLVISNCWFLPYNLAGCIKLNGPDHVRIINNVFGGTTGAVAGSAKIDLTGCLNVNIGGNIVEDGTHPYAVRVNANCENIKIYDNIFTSYATAPYYFTDKSVVNCHDNIFKNALLQNNYGAGTIANGQTYVDVTHGIFTTPESVNVTPQENEAVWVSDVGASTFRINRVGSSGDLVCNWFAGIKTY